MKRTYITTAVAVCGLMASFAVYAASSVDFRFVNFRWWVDVANPSIEPCGMVTVNAKAHHDTQSTEARGAVLTWTIDGKTSDVMRKWVSPKGTYATTASFEGSCTPGTHEVEFTACVVGIGGNLNKCSSQLKKFTLSYTVKEPPNSAPNQPTITKDSGERSGTFTGEVSKPYTFIATATDPQGDQLAYEFDWTDDGVDTPALRVPATGSVPSGTSQNASNSWTTSGSKTIKVRSCDTKSACSAWTSYALTIASSDCSDLGKGIAAPSTVFNIADISELERGYLKLSSTSKDINGDQSFDYADVVALVQCNVCLWNWRACSGSQ